MCSPVQSLQERHSVHWREGKEHSPHLSRALQTALTRILSVPSIFWQCPQRLRKISKIVKENHLTQFKYGRFDARLESSLSIKVNACTLHDVHDDQSQAWQVLYSFSKVSWNVETSSRVLKGQFFGTNSDSKRLFSCEVKERKETGAVRFFHPLHPEGN